MAWNPNIPTVTNRVQDDLNAIRENFQHLDPLAQVVGELQAVSGLAPVANELQTVSGLAQITDDLQAVSALAPYAQALLDSRIVEMGSNSNGTYVRWENGIQVCWHVMTGLGPISEPWGALYSSPLYSWTFPSAFLGGSVPVVMVSGGRANHDAAFAGTRDPSSTGTSGFWLWRADSNEETDWKALLFAIGVWK